MTVGALIFAFSGCDNNLDYISLAKKSAESIKQYLNIPVCLVTDSLSVSDNVFDRIIHKQAIEGGKRYWKMLDKKTSWYNIGRSDSFELSPWDTTLVVDADYLIFGDSLRSVLESPNPFMCFKEQLDLPHMSDTGPIVLGKAKLPLWWATVIKFDKSNRSQLIFGIWKMIENNYSYYADFFGLKRTPYRNDYALSIALLIASGNQQPNDVAIPWKLFNVSVTNSIQLANNAVRVEYLDSRNSRRLSYLTITGHDIHVMDKHVIGRILED
jgi:hypothetical protein